MTSESDLDRIAVVVHEVRSPVAALSSIAVVYGTAVDGERRTLAELALAACQAIERVVGDAALSSMRMEDVDLARVARDAAATAELGGAEVDAVTPATARIEGDPVRLRQAVDNLVTNAVQHAAGAEVEVRVEVGERAASIAVSDRGPGIDPADLERIFEPGVRVGERAGTGLGLAVARAIAVAHGGTLTVDSAPGTGATFTLTLPARADA